MNKIEENPSGKTELMLAVENESLEAIKAKVSSMRHLIFFGDELFRVDSNGRSILFYVAARGNVDIAWAILSLLPGTGILCKRGKLLEMKDDNDLLPEDFAKMEGNDKIYKLFSCERMRIEYFE